MSTETVQAIDRVERVEIVGKRLEPARIEYKKLTKEVIDKVEVLTKLYDRTLRYQGWPPSNRIRLHSNGDFFNEVYFLSWCFYACLNPDLTIYTYTKSIDYIVKYLNYIPKNFKITASRGGRHDYLIDESPHYFKKIARVVYSKEQADELGIPIDTTDEYAYNDYKGEFAHLLHGTQPLNTTAALALKELHKEGHKGYSRDKYKRKLSTLPLTTCKELGILYCSPGNAKLLDTLVISLPAGYSCPAALTCRSSCNPDTGRISDYPSTQFRCYAASMEARSSNLRNALWHNYNLLLSSLR